MIEIIISGGQTGADRAALDFALQNDIACGGYCPRDRKAEDGCIPYRYPLKESRSEQYEHRTFLNVQSSDATLIIFGGGELSGGSLYTRQAAGELDKPLLLIDYNNPLQADIAKITSWIAHHQIRKLNIAGPRASSDPLIYEKTFQMLKCLYQKGLIRPLRQK